MKLQRIAAVIVSIATASGCSGTKISETGAAASRGAASPIANPCKLLTHEEAEAAMGEKLTPGDLQHYGPATRCRFFHGVDEDLRLDAQDASLFETFTHLPDAKPVSGIGDQALWLHSEYGTFLHILNSGRLVSMGLPRKMATMTPGVEKAARLVASRM